MDTTDISIIIPSLNEESNISETLSEISKNKSICNPQVIIVDNGSTDRTVSIAESLGATVLIYPEASIGELRNIGVLSAKNEIIAFIDADITLDKKWFQEIINQKAALEKNPLILTGNRVLPPNRNFISTYWFSKLSNKKTKQNYINSGNLITTKETFKIVGGFSQQLKTSEDYDFCQKAIKLGATINPNPNFVAWHRGYPENIFEFIRRESWHGSEDTRSLTNIVKSKTALIALLNLIFFLGSIILSFALLSVTPIAIYAIFLAVTSVSIVVLKIGTDPVSSVPASSLIAAAYLTGRSIAYVKNFGRHRATEFSDRQATLK